ncbi:MAG: fibrobacter succinogenes major paralogous domain-containing protein [Bacteroidales bacterium]|nr:fibrobacter succinogenes major paralogous domain-containing protein [Bacteroidales bacterium]
MKQLFIFLIVSFLLAAQAIAQEGSIDNVTAEQRTDGSGLVDVYYDLSGPEDEYYINMRVSFDAGEYYYGVSLSELSGDAGLVSPGSRQLVWNPTINYPNRYSPETKIKLMAFYGLNTNPCPGMPTVEDIDGNTYFTTQIGEQCWMASNLNTTRDANGNQITNYCYDEDPGNCEMYGGLYEWDVMMNGEGSSNGNPSGVQGICPDGWHIPSDAEWSELTNYLINNYIDINSGNVGNKLKSCRQVNSPLGDDCNTSEHPRWNEHGNQYGTNDFGFASLPGGHRLSNGYFFYLGQKGYWWSCTETFSTYVWHREMGYSSGSVYRDYYDKAYGFSVRCIKD